MKHDTKHVIYGWNLIGKRLLCRLAIGFFFALRKCAQHRNVPNLRVDSKKFAGKDVLAFLSYGRKMIVTVSLAEGTYESIHCQFSTDG